jgi:3-isopropylmalate/(R)-2-methylmalate dehydratase large subunit
MRSVPESQTLAQKLIARAARKPSVSFGDILTCHVDLAMFHDSSGPRRLKPMLETLNAEVWDKSRVVLVMDHYVPERDAGSRKIVQIARDWARDQNLPYVYDGIGICHVVLPQKGHIRPGMFCVGGDSHSPTGGALGAYMFGIGSTEMLGVLVTGKIWVRVPETIVMHWNGPLQRGVMAKDMILSMLGRFGMNGGNYQAIEFSGETVKTLAMQERMTLSNMSAELGSQVGLIAPDETTMNWLRETGVSDLEIEEIKDLKTDDDAKVTRYDFDATALDPQIAAPHSPANVTPVKTHLGLAFDVAYIGACTGAKLYDLRAAADCLRGHRISPHTQLMVAPASLEDQRAAESDGTLEILRQAGAQLLPNACGACAGYGATIPDGARVMATTARNFKGRMGSPSAEVFLASPYTVAASALRGCITDPREVLA